ncbi:MAG: AraC family transcriptional regulator [Lewinellaceae bacterium]|nr:AraC family transcriptional regulator [Phaeodactylibacter sp.]MCB9037201.1 AraC family transcriptional regulator [Lewinellaceae bacterium]
MNSNLSVSEIACETGFANPSYFTNIFTQEFGTRPYYWTFGGYRVNV